MTLSTTFTTTKNPQQPEVVVGAMGRERERERKE